MTFDSAYTVTGNTLTLSTATITANANATLNSALAGSTTVDQGRHGRTPPRWQQPTHGRHADHWRLGARHHLDQFKCADLHRVGRHEFVARTITVNSGATLRFDAADAIGSYNSATHATLIADGGTITRTAGSFNSLGNITLKNGAHLTSANNNGTVNSFTLNGPVRSRHLRQLHRHLRHHQQLLPSLDCNRQQRQLHGGRHGQSHGRPLSSAPLRDKTLGGAAGIAELGLGKMILSGANACSGVTTLSAGTLALGSATAIGTGALTITGGTLDSSVGQDLG